MFIAASVLTMGGLTSCSNENDVQMEQPGAEKGVPTAMTLTIDMKGVSTRAEQNPDGLLATDFTTAEETALETLDVYIYDTKTGILDQHHPLTKGAGITEAQGKYTTKALTAFTGKKKVFVGLNLTDAMKTVMEKSTLQVLETSAVTEELAKMTSTTTGFSMFCPQGEEKTFVEATKEQAAQNKVVISVERMVAKIGIGAKVAPTQLGANGTLGQLQFVVDNIGKKFYMPSTKNDPSMTAGAWVPGDFVNYDFNGDGDPADAPTATWLNVQESNDQKTWKTAYSTENYVADNKLKGMTRVVVRATFIPAKELTYTLEVNGTLIPAQTAIAANTNYYQLDVPGDNKFVFLSTLPDEASVKAYYKAVKNQDYNGQNILKDHVKTYANGYHYWWVTMAGKGQEGNVERNHVYLANIKNISLPGRPDGEFDDVKDKDEELDKETNIEVEVTVIPWSMVTFDADLKP